MKILLIDDIREMEADVVARTFDEGIAALKSDSFTLLLLDHDLGDPDPRKTGYDILSWLERNPKHLPKDIKVISMNSVGIQKMNVVIKRLYSN